MFTYIHKNINSKVGETVNLTYVIYDENNELLDITDADAELLIARKVGLSPILSKQKNNGIVCSEYEVQCTFNTSEFLSGSNQLTGDFIMQLFLTIDGETYVAAEGRLNVADTIIRS